MDGSTTKGNHRGPLDASTPLAGERLSSKRLDSALDRGAVDVERESRIQCVVETFSSGVGHVTLES